MATTCNNCTTTDSFTGDFKSQSSSLTFQMCDGGSPVLVQSDVVADHIINTIYGDTNGNPPPEGCYSVCYDSNGVMSLTDTATQAELDVVSNNTQNQIEECQKVLLNTPVLLFGSSDLNVEFLSFGGGQAWGNEETKVFSVTPPNGKMTHAIVEFYAVASNSSDHRVYDEVRSDRVFALTTGNDDDDHSSYHTTPVQINSNNEIILRKNGTSNGLQVRLVGYEVINTI